MQFHIWAMHASKHMIWRFLVLEKKGLSLALPVYSIHCIDNT